MIQALTIVIQAPDRPLASYLCHMLETDPRIRLLSVMRTGQQIYEEVQRRQPDIVLLPLGTQPQVTWALCQELRQVAPDTVVICAAQDASPDLILDTLRNGAHEFLRLPIRPEELQTVLDRIVATRASRSQRTPSAGKRGRVIAVFSPKGGCGTSFIAANVAVGVDAPTVLMDLNLQASSQDLYFGVKPRFSWVDLIENHARLDDQMLASLLAPYNERLSLLAAPAKAENAEEITSEQIHEAIVALRERFDYVVLDVMHTFDALTLSALDLADDILLVLGLDIIAVRAAQRALTIFQRLGYPREKVRLVLNRWNKQSELELREIERALGQPVANLISDDYRTVVSSLNLGQPLLTQSNPPFIGAELQQLLAACELPLVGQASTAKRGLFDMLLRRNTASLPADKAKNTTQSLLHPVATPPAPRPPALLGPPTTPPPAERGRSTPLPPEPKRSAPLPPEPKRSAPLPPEPGRSAPLPPERARTTPLPAERTRTAPLHIPKDDPQALKTY